MANYPRLNTYPTSGSITISNGVYHKVNISGDFFRVKSADEDFKILIDDEAQLSVSQNSSIRLTPGDSFKNLTVYNDSGADLTFQLEIGFGEVDSRTVSIDGIMKTEEQAVSNITSTADVSLTASSKTSIKATNTNRKEIIITSLLANTDPIRIGDTDITATRGVELNPGDSITLKTTAEVFGYNTKANVQSVAILEVI